MTKLFFVLVALGLAPHFYIHGDKWWAILKAFVGSL